MPETLRDASTGQPVAKARTTDDLEPQAPVIPDDVLARLDAAVGDMAAPIVALAADLAGERDAALERAATAEALSSRLVKALAYLVKEWPQTSWGSSNDAHDTAKALLDEVAGQGATMGATTPAPVQEN